MSDVLEYKCPNCSGGMEFDAESQKLKCPYCESEFDIDEFNSRNNTSGAEEEGSESTENVNWHAEGMQWSEDEKSDILVYVCGSCGGEVVTDKTTAAAFCPYCGNPIVIKGQLSGELRPDLVIPFKLDKKAAVEALTKFISSKKLIPKIFKDKNHIDEIKGIYVPYWLFSCTASADIKYKATKLRHWSDSNYNYTETSYYDIYRSGSLGFGNIPVDGSVKMDDALMESIEPFDIADGVDFKTAYLSGFFADKYDVSAENSMPRANERVAHSLSDALRSTVSGYSSVQTAKTNLNIADGGYKYALYPVWLLNTTWNKEKFTFAVNGQTGRIVGNLPLDKRAFAGWTALLSAGFSVLLYILLGFFM